MVLTENDLRVFRARLNTALDQTMNEIRGIDEQVQTYVASGQDASYGVDNHLGDQADVVYEEERLLSVRAGLRDRQDLIEAALLKMDRGQYGVCDECHQPIAQDRLEALPYAAYCIRCAEKLDRRRGGRP
ncbi:MAG TPA: TraR/DksA C4-type zinc finger protein [Thermomicrobiaceae bacterium]|nr:TraR/DksA C4-type zinc finger protein [Thermomicrobiaceae bacterium]